jgi:Cytochrome C biogenesis protein transmembrane region
MSTVPLPIAAFCAGLVSFLSPCVLPLVPGYVSLISGVGIQELRSQESRSLRKVMLTRSGSSWVSTLCSSRWVRSRPKLDGCWRSTSQHWQDSPAQFPTHWWKWFCTLRAWKLVPSPGAESGIGGLLESSPYSLPHSVGSTHDQSGLARELLADVLPSIQ